MCHYHSVFLLEISEHLSSIFLSVSRSTEAVGGFYSSLNNRDGAGHMSENFLNSVVSQCGIRLWLLGPDSSPGLLASVNKTVHLMAAWAFLVELAMCYYLLWERYCFYSIKQWLSNRSITGMLKNWGDWRTFHFVGISWTKFVSCNLAFTQISFP